MDDETTAETPRRRKATPTYTTADETTRWPSLRACLAAWTVDGDPAARPTLTFFYAGPTCVKAVLHDRRAGMQLWATASTVLGVLDALDGLLGGPDVPWETAAAAGPQGLLRKLFEAVGGRKRLPELQ